MRTIEMLVVATVALVLGACSAVEPTPSAFEAMTPDQVGCVISYGEFEYEVGPLGPSDSETIEPNLYTKFRLGRTAVDLVIVVDRASDGMNGSIAVDQIPPEGTVVARNGLVDSGNPGYEIVCWGADG